MASSLRFWLACAAVAALAGGISCTRVEEIGGRWQVETQRGIPEAGNSVEKLYRKAPTGRRLVSAAVGHWRYYGDDCIVYETPLGAHNIQYFVACGDRAPVEIVEENYNYWQLDAAGMVRLDEVPGSFAKKPGQRITVEELKARALGRTGHP